MIRKIGIALIVVTALALSVATAFAAKAGAHWVTEPTCTFTSSTSISCTAGSVAGLGNEPVTFVATVPGGCATSGNESQPPGHLQSSPQTIQPRGGRINLPAVSFSVNCPPGLNPVLGDEVTYTIRNQAGDIVFQDVIAVS
jgi:hypothetical protein